MRWLMLCREPRLYSCQRLKQACEQRGYHLDILDPNRFLLSLVQGQFQLYYQQGEPYEKTRPSLEKIPHYQGVLARFGTSSTEMGCNVLRHFELQGIPCFNNSAAVRLARDKWQSLQQLMAAQIPVVDTLLAGELCSPTASLDFFPLPSVIKTLSGSQGVGVMLAESKSGAHSLLTTLQQAKIATLQQRFIAESQGRDIRAFVIGDEVVASMQRIGKQGEFRANIHQGGKAEAIQLTVPEQQLAVRATKALGLDIAGVDLIRSNAGLLVLEVNASPGLEMIEQISQMDIAGKMVDFISNKIRCSF